jgi:RNA polymerase sigma factor (sigma-70 family)
MERECGDPLSDAIDAEAILRTEAVLEQLPPAQREVVSLRVFGDLTLSEIAEAMETPLATVKSRMRYGLEKAREILEQRAEVMS